MTAELTSESRVFDYKLLVEEERGKVKIHAKSHKTMNPRWDLICCDSWTGHQYHQTRR
jgi:hypothetical protein